MPPKSAVNRILAGAGLILALAGPSSAQPPLPEFRAGMKSLGLEIGGAVPADTNGFGTSVHGGPTAGFQFVDFPWSWIALGCDLSVAKFNRKAQSDDTSAVFGLTSASDLGLQAEAVAAAGFVRFNLKDDSSWTPYLLGGIGVHQFWAKADWAPAGGPPGAARLSKNASVHNFMALGAAGLEGFVWENASLSFEARFASLRLDSGKFAANNVESLSYLFGVHYWLGQR